MSTGQALPTTLPRAAARQDTAVRARERAGHAPRWLHLVGCAVWLCAVIWSWQAGELRSYGDALARELLARRVTDSLTPGLAQLGTVWLPLPSFVLVPLDAIDPLWHLGIAGALVGGIYLQLAIGALYRAGYLLGGAAAGIVAVIAFLANPNTLYLFTIPLSEAPSLTFGCLCGAGLAEALVGFRRGELRLGAVLATAFAAAATLLCRFDGWMLAVASGALLCAASLIWLRDRHKTEAVALFYAVAPVTAIGLWLLYNWAIFGHPLAFQRGPNSIGAQLRDLAARGLIPSVNGRPVDAGHPLGALITYGQAVLENTGVLPAILAVAGAVVALCRARSRPAGLAIAALATPFVFYVIALYGGQGVIVTRAANPTGLWNVRYGGAIAPAIALAIAALAGLLQARPWRLTVPPALALAMIVSGGLLFAAPLGPVTIAEGTLQGRGVGTIGGREAARWLAAQPDSGPILLDEGLEPQTQALMVYGDRPLRRYVTSASPEYWDAALREPARAVALIVTLGPTSAGFPSDRVAKALLVDGGIAGFTRVYDNGEIVIFQRATLPPARTPAPEISPGGAMTLLQFLSPPVVSLGKALMGTLGVALVCALVALLLLREALPVTANPRLRRWRSRLTASLAPLVLFLVAVLVIHLLLISAPVLAAEFDPPETTGQTAANPSPTAGQAASDPAPIRTSPAAAVSPAPTAVAATPAATLPAMTPQSTPARTAAPALSPQRIASIVAGLSTGQFEATIVYTSGARSSIVVRFDLGNGQQPARLYTQTTYQGATGARSVERIAIGDQSWTREQGQSWVQAATSQEVREEVQAFLPGVEALVAQGRPDGANALSWYDATRDADLRLVTDPLTGAPQQLQQTTRGTGTVLTVTYRGWNTPVEIAPPAGQ